MTLQKSAYCVGPEKMFEEVRWMVAGMVHTCSYQSKCPSTTKMNIVEMSCVPVAQANVTKSTHSVSVTSDTSLTNSFSKLPGTVLDLRSYEVGLGGQRLERQWASGRRLDRSCVLRHLATILHHFAIMRWNWLILAITLQHEMKDVSKDLRST